MYMVLLWCSNFFKLATPMALGGLQVAVDYEVRSQLLHVLLNCHIRQACFALPCQEEKGQKAADAARLKMEQEPKMRSVASASIWVLFRLLQDLQGLSRATGSRSHAEVTRLLQMAGCLKELLCKTLLQIPLQTFEPLKLH